MPRYKLTLQDAAGKSRSATVEAGSQAEAVDLARRKGYQVRQIESVYDLDAGGDPPAPMETAEHGYGYSQPRARKPAAEPAPARPGTFSLLLPTALAGLALLVSLGTLGYVLVRGTGKTDATEAKPDPLGPGLAAYDLSTASKTLEAEARIEAKLDLRAGLELERKTRGGRAGEKAETTKVYPDREKEFRGAKVVFYSYKEKGETRFRTQGYEKAEEAGVWVKKTITPADVQADNPALADAMRDWEANGPEREKDKAPRPPKK